MPPGASHSAAGLAPLSLARQFLVQLAVFLVPRGVLWPDAAGHQPVAQVGDLAYFLSGC